MNLSREQREALLGACVKASNRAGQLACLAWRMAAEGQDGPEAVARLRERINSVWAELGRVEGICAQPVQDGQSQ